MNKVISVYELLGLVKDNRDKDVYCKYIDNITDEENTMLACVENIVDRLDNKSICLNDKVKVAIFDEDKPTIEKISINGKDIHKLEELGIYDVIEDIESTLNEIVDKIEKESK